MALPPWTVDLLRRGVQDLARQATDPETKAALKEQASKLAEELPRVAREKVEAIWKQAESTTRPLKNAWDRGDFFRGLSWPSRADENVPRRLINASGVLMHPGGSGIALSPSVQAAVIPFVSGEASLLQGIDERYGAQISAAFHSTPSGDGGDSGSDPCAAIVMGSLKSAIAVLRPLGHRGGQFYVPRIAAARLLDVAGNSSECIETFAEVLRQHGSVREFGTIDSSSTLDVSEITRDPSVPHSSGTKHRRSALIRTADIAINAAELPASCVHVVVIQSGTFFDHPNQQSSLATSSIEKELAAGADLVILAGGPLSGTLPIGILVGRTSVIDHLRNQSLVRYGQVPTGQLAMVAAAVRDERDGRTPVIDLSKVSESNLSDRADRLATQLGAAASVTSVRVGSEPARMNETSATTLPSRQVLIRTPDGAGAMMKELADQQPGILTRTVGDELAIDLRWVSPEQQSVIAQAFR